MTHPGEPFFSVISACYQVEKYLPDFIASIESQELEDGALEAIMVDDGSSDGTQRLLEEWAATSRHHVRVVRQDNAGQGAARNTGLALARGVWATFPDPDDILDPDYFTRVRTFVEANPQTDMVATNRWMLNDTTKELTASHPLRKHFRTSDVLRNLAMDDQYFHGSAPASFFRVSRINALGLTYDTRIRPNFEDGHFCTRYLLDLPEPKVGFVRSARYQYRKRQDSSSTLQTSKSNPGRYTVVPRYGYLDVLERARATHGHVPLWVQNFVIYELNYYLGREDSAVGTIAPAEVRAEFHELMASVTALLDPEAIRSYNVTPLRGTTRDILEHGYRDESWHSSFAVIAAHDPEQGLLQLMYRFTGEAPSESVELGSRPLVPAAAKTRDVVLHDRVLLHERLVWVPTRRVRLRVDGKLLPLVEQPPSPTNLRVRPALLPPRPAPIDVPAPEVPEPVKRPEDQLQVIELAASPASRTRFREAWVLMDRIHNADDSAEHLFAWIRENRPKVNAFFTIEEGTADWFRLRGLYGDRVVAHGTPEWSALMLNAKHLISSHADVAVTLPPSLRPYRPWPWRFTFLQHGVIKDDLSGWLNSRPLDLFVTSTRGEYASVVDDHTTYRYTSKEAVLTGLPRFDLLHAAAERFPAEKRDLVLVSPTWRVWLVPQLEDGSQRRGAYDWFTESDYFHAWNGLLNSEEIARVCREQGLTLALLPHPNMESALEGVELPSHVEKLSFDGTDVREIFARAAVLVTDYSSTAFNAAYIERPVVYFQFDHEQMVNGGHVGRPGYFDYRRDGYGPVVDALPEAIDAVVETLEAGRAPRSPWRERIDEAFPYRDGDNRARVFAAIRAMDKGRKPEFEQD